MATLPNALPKLAADPSGRALGLELPPGRLIDATDDGPWHEPLLWQADGPAAPGGWAALEPARRTAGLLPLLLDVGGGQGGPEKWDLVPGEMSYPGDHDAEEVLAGYWDEYGVIEVGPDDDDPGRASMAGQSGEPVTYDEMVAPFGLDWPGLAQAGPLTADPDAQAAEVVDSLLSEGSWFKEPRLALVPARRSADILAAIGWWSGPVNYEEDTARLCAILRSWEDRFGIRVVAVTFDRLVLSVAAPATTQAEAEAVAAEHFAFCPDTITLGDHQTLRAYAEHEVLGQRVWSFWWED